MNGNNSFLNNENNMDKYNQNNYSRSLYNQNTDNYFEDEKKLNEKPKKNKRFIIIIVVLVLAIAGIGLYFLINKGESNEIIVNFLIDEMELKVGNNEIISYSVSDKNVEVPMIYESSNEEIAVVNSKGKVFGIKEGKTTVRVTYTINGKRFIKNINVIVTKK